MPKNVIIVGAPRSGTSMTALIFTKKGYFVTEDNDNDLQSANEFNPDGFWEASGLRDSNEQLFHKIGFPFANTWLFDVIKEEQANEILNIDTLDKHQQLVEDYNKKSPWMWKDPNLCYTIGYWWRLMNPETTGILFLKRNPEEIYKSFLRLEWCKPGKNDKEKTMKRINHHIDYAEMILSKNNIPHLTVNYAEYATSPELTAKRISEYFDLELTVADLGFNKKYNTSGMRGHLMRWGNWLGNMMPNSLRKVLKKLLPTFVLKIIFPMRYTK